MEFKMKENISSYQFYKMLGDIERILNRNGSEQMILDFTEVQTIDALAIPNLLFLGKYIQDRTGYIPYIRLGEDIQAGRLKKYLNDINFYNISTPFFLYENGEDGKYGGMSGIDMDPRNTTQYFSMKGDLPKVKEETERRIFYELLPFLNYYLKKFNVENESTVEVLSEEVFEKNVVAYLIKQMMLNCAEHANSDAIITVQANYRKKKILLAVSDQGKGFLNAIMEKPVESDGGYNVLQRVPETELEGIFTGIYKRREVKAYGLYNTIKKTLSFEGLVRIHSNHTKLILTPRLLTAFCDESLINRSDLIEYNVDQTREWKGVHLEIELPL